MQAQLSFTSQLKPESGINFHHQHEIISPNFTTPLTYPHRISYRINAQHSSCSLSQPRLQGVPQPACIVAIFPLTINNTLLRRYPIRQGHSRIRATRVLKTTEVPVEGGIDRIPTVSSGLVNLPDGMKNKQLAGRFRRRKVVFSFAAYLYGRARAFIADFSASQPDKRCN